MKYLSGVGLINAKDFQDQNWELDFLSLEVAILWLRAALALFAQNVAARKLRQICTLMSIYGQSANKVSIRANKYLLKLLIFWFQQKPGNKLHICYQGKMTLQKKAWCWVSRFYFDIFFCFGLIFAHDDKVVRATQLKTLRYCSASEKL